MSISPAPNVPPTEEATKLYQTAISQRSKSVPWFYPPLAALNPSALKVLLEYSGISSEAEAVAHVLRIRDKAWSIFPYPCIGSYRFLDFSIHSNPLYPEILASLTPPAPASTTTLPSFLDLGCCFAQDLRKLLHDGASPSHLFGAELRPEFVELGEELFLDGDKPHGHIYTAIDVFSPSTLQSVVGADGGKFRYVHMAAFLHLWGMERQREVLRNVVRDLLSEESGASLVGRQAGSRRAGEYDHPTNGDGKMWRHDVGTFKKLFEEVGEECGVEWASVEVWEEGWVLEKEGGDGEGRKVQGAGTEHKETYFAGKDDTKLTFVVRRA